MPEAWRVPFSRSLKNCPPEQRRADIHWVAQFLGSGHPEARFLRQVPEAREALRHWPRFRSDEAWNDAIAAMVQALRLKHLSYRTEKSYLGWMQRFRTFIGDAAPDDVTPKHVEAFLSHLAVKQDVSASTQNQAFSALLFLHRHILHRDLEGLSGTVRARQKRRLPVVLSRQEVADVLARLPPRFALMARLIYGAGLRLQECLELRVKDVDLERGILTIRTGKGDKDRQTALPESLRVDWSKHAKAIRALHDQDRRAGIPGVALPLALERKYPNAGNEWGWFWAFPADNVSTDLRSKVIRRHHQHASAFQKQFKQAVRGAGVGKPATTPCVRASRPISSRLARTSARSRNCLDTGT